MATKKIQGKATPQRVKAQGLKRAQRTERARGAHGTQERILRAATTAFAMKGYSGARVDSICRAARANPRMIYHYFGDKDGLYIAVLDHVLGQLRGEELKLAMDHVEPLEGIVQLFDFMHGHFGRHPELIHLLSGENLLRGRFLRRSLKARIVASPLIALIAGLLARGERTKIFRPGIDPLQLYVMMAALCYFHRSNAYTLSSIFAENLLAPTWQNRHKHYAIDMVERFLLHEPSRSRDRH